MSLSSLQQALAHPTNHAHDAPYQFGIGGSHTNGPVNLPTTLTGADPFGTTIQNDGNDNYGSGAVYANGTIKSHLYVDKTNRRPHDTFQGAYCFIETKAPNGVGREVEYRIISLNRLNYYLNYDIDFRTEYGTKNHAHELKRNLPFYGVQVGETKGEYSNNLSHVSTTQAFCTAQRTRAHSPFAALESNTYDRGTVRQWDHLWFIARRYKYVDAITVEFGKNTKRLLQDKENTSRMKKRRLLGGAAMDDLESSVKNVNEYFWRIEPYVSVDGKAPPEEVYSQPDIFDPDDATKLLHEGWTGFAIHLGKVWNVYGDQKISKKVLNAARRAIHPTREDDTHIRETSITPQVEFYMRVY